MTNSNYKLGDRYLDFESLTPFPEGTVLKKGQLVVLIKGGSKEFPLGIIMQVDEDNNTCPYLLPKHSNGGQPFKSTHRLAPLPTNITIRHGGLTASAKKSKAPKPTWTTRTEHERSDNILIQKDTIRIDGKVYTIDEAKGLEVKLRASIRYYKAQY